MDLTTRYMGLALDSPLVASASPLNTDIGNLKRLEDAGVGAVVLPSMFEEQIEAETRRYEALSFATADSFPEALSYFPEASVSHTGSHAYLELVRRATEAVRIPVIASINGVTDEGWVSCAHEIEQAGAKGLELNIYYIPTDLALSGYEVEQRYLETLRAVRQRVKIPIAVKIGPYFSAPGHMARELDRAGADALVLFNRFYQPDIDLASLRLRKDLNLSTRNEMRLPLLWIAVLAGQVRASLAATTGVDGPDEVLKYILAGADVAMTTSAMLRHGPGHARTILDGVRAWMAARNVRSIAEIRGRMSRGRAANPAAFDRGNYIEILEHYRPEH